MKPNQIKLPPEFETIEIIEQQETDRCAEIEQYLG